MSRTTPLFTALRHLALVGVIALGSPLLGGCAEVVIGGAAATGVAAYQERGVSGVAKDVAASAEIQEMWFQHNEGLPIKVGVEVYEGRAMLTGAVETEQERADAVRLAWKANGVTDVINEIQVSETGISDVAQDSWITTQIKTNMTFDKEIMAINYSVETVNSIVYIIGIAQNQAELNLVLNHARSVSYVKKVINHVRVK